MKSQNIIQLPHDFGLGSLGSLGFYLCRTWASTWGFDGGNKMTKLGMGRGGGQK
jgi:hypothetical protein